jgi:hypothetical protein
MNRIAPVLCLLLVLGGCASTPSVSELRGGVRSASFIQYGTEPLNYTFGVVDTGSFWAAHGGGVSSNLGFSAIAEIAAGEGRADVARKAPAAAEVMKVLYGNHSLVKDVSNGVMPQLAQAWAVPFEPRQLRVMQPGKPLEDDQGNLIGASATTDLVLVFALNQLTLTEKFSAGGALAAGFTLGTNTKKVAAETTVTMRAYKQDPASGQYKKVWTGLCQGPAMFSSVSYPFPEVVQSREKARELWDAIVPVTIEYCSKHLERMARS